MTKLSTKEAWLFIVDAFEKRWVRGEECNDSIRSMTINGLCYAVTKLYLRAYINKQQSFEMHHRIEKDINIFKCQQWLIDPNTGKEDSYYKNNQLRIDKAREYAGELL